MCHSQRLVRTPASVRGAVCIICLRGCTFLAARQIMQSPRQSVPLHLDLRFCIYCHHKPQQPAKVPQLIMSKRTNTRGNRSTRRDSSSNPNVEESEEEEEVDVLAEMFSILAEGDSHWYPINGDTSIDIALCKLLGFTSFMDFYACLMNRSLSKYTFSKKKKKMSISILSDNWPKYLINKRYGLSPDNAEFAPIRIDMENFLLGKQQRDNNRHDYYAIRLGSKLSPTYAHKLSLQRDLVPTIPGWRSKQRYFRRNTNKEIIDTLLDNEEVYLDAIEELDLHNKSDADKKSSTPSTHPDAEDKSNSPPSLQVGKKQKTHHQEEEVPMGEPQQSYWRGVVSTVITKTTNSFRGLFPFTNSELNRDTDFDLDNPADKHKVDNHLTDFMNMKTRHSGNNFSVQYVDSGNGKIQSVVKVPAATSDKAFRNRDPWLDEVVTANSRLDGDTSSSVRRITKGLLKRDQAAVLEINYSPS
jgi:hypothetical protein